MLTFHIITIFPEALDSYISASLLGKAQKKKLIKINRINMRRFTSGKHKKVDDSPYGGGPGMVMKAEPIAKAVEKIKSAVRAHGKKGKKLKTRVILFSTRGKQFTSAVARRLSAYDHLILICGRYEGVDERVAERVADEEISMGEYVLSGGELPALVLTEAVSRYVPGMLGKYESLEDIKGSYPVYTRPEIVLIGKKKARVPKALISGNHKEIEVWRKGFDKK